MPLKLRVLYQMRLPYPLCSAPLHQRSLMASIDLTIQRVRHELKMRLLQVVRPQLVSPQLLRVTLSGDVFAM